MLHEPPKVGGFSFDLISSRHQQRHLRDAQVLRSSVAQPLPENALNNRIPAIDHASQAAIWMHFFF
jgi:hypothetical protein